MNYLECIKEGFELYDKIDMELRKLGKISNPYHEIKYSNDTLEVVADSLNAALEVKFTITKDEVVERVLKDKLEPVEAIGILLKEKVCKNAKYIE